MMAPRSYQQACVDAIWRNLDCHCVASVPTGGGKSLIIAMLIQKFLEYPGTHILLLTHQRELIRQNAVTLEKHLPFTVDLGVYCAGLRSKQLRPVTIASVQSLVNATELPPFEIIIVDECHLIPHGSDGQYHTVFAKFPDARIIGLTATPFRLDSGKLHEGEHKLFDKLVYEAKTGDLIRQGYLSPIRAKQVSEHADLEDVHMRGGDYIPTEMTAAMDQDKITQAAAQDVVKLAADRKSILVFCAGIEHAKHVKQAFEAAGQTSIAVITQETGMHQRDETTKAFKNGSLRILCNVAVLTTGFDAPNIDCVVMLRATKSAGLYVQILGRGLRKCEGKEYCLLLDYGNNIETHGPLDMISSSTINKEKGEAITKTCPTCQSIIFAGFKVCPDCGYVFPENDKSTEKHGVTASDLDPISPTIIEEYDVKEVFYTRHEKHGKPPSLRVLYKVGLWKDVQEYICPEHLGFAQQKAQAWFARRGIVPMPKTVDEAMTISGALPLPVKIHVRKNGKYDEILRYEWTK